jgi:4-hydroxybenzoate polyprenyltransferase
MRTLGRLLRLSLAPSAAADIAAGLILGAGAWPRGAGPFLLIAASLCVYHGGLVLNDWADRAHDAATRPERPIPAGRVPAGGAALLAFTLLVAGPWIALGAGREPAYALGGVAALAAAYDLFGRGPVLGPLLLAACRAGNLGAGVAYGRLAAAGGPLPLGAHDGAVPLLYGFYVGCVSCLGRLEDGEDERLAGARAPTLVAVSAALLLALPLLPLPALAEVPAAGALAGVARHGRALAGLVAAAGALGLLRAALRPGPWTRPRVMQTMGMALRRLLVFTAAAALLRGTPHGSIVALAILAGYPLSFALRRAFPPS